MVKFFNPKEDVMDIKMTPYGRHLLSRGEFVPSFYAFFDDDIIYDQQYASASIGEQTNDIDDRIRHETPRIKVQSGFAGVETSIKRTVEMVKHKKAALGDPALQPLADKHYALSLPLGHSSLTATAIPAWDMFFLNGEIGSTIKYLSGSSSPNMKIPQLDCELTYKVKSFAPGVPRTLSAHEMKLSALPLGWSDGDEVGMWAGVFDDFEDGSQLKVYKDILLLELNEENTDYLSANFDIEVYEIQQVTGSTNSVSGLGQNEYEELVPLSFARERMADLGASYLVDEADDFGESFPEVDPSYVEHFFEINVDREIDPNLVCAYLPNDKARRKKLGKEFDCPDKFGRHGTFANAGAGLYDSNILEDPEDCD